MCFEDAGKVPAAQARTALPALLAQLCDGRTIPGTGFALATSHETE
jgi:hypothetical protein